MNRARRRHLFKAWNRHVFQTGHLRTALTALLLLLAKTAPAQEMHPFSTDGCSLFPDRLQIAHADWCSCCLAHDLAYWRGGTYEERLKADQNLQSCVLATTGNATLADLMYAGVRAGGGPYFFTTYRWGYGWSFGRMYEPLSPAENAQATSLRDKYLANNPNLACPAATR